MMKLNNLPELAGMKKRMVSIRTVMNRRDEMPIRIQIVLA
jgi:hypothetical protein